MAICSVLLIEDSSDSATLVNHFLGSSKISEFRVVTVTTLQAAREALAIEPFDAILLDLNLPDSRGIETYARVREVARGAAIVILTGVEEESVATQAIGQGAADYLIKGEVGGEGLARRVRFAVERSRVASPAAEPAPVGRITAVVGAKGGVGASTMAVNLAMLCSRTGKNAIVIELRPNAGSLATLLNVNTVLTLDALAEFGGGVTLEAATGKLPFGVRLLAAPAGLSSVSRWEPATVEALLDRAVATADHVFVDAAPGSADILKAVVARARFTVLVAEREPVSIQLGARMVGAVAGWATHAGAVGAVLVNHLPFMDAAPLPAIRAELNCGILGVLPPAREILQSYRRQGPIVQSQPASPVAAGFEEVARRLEQDPVPFLL